MVIPCNQHYMYSVLTLSQLDSVNFLGGGTLNTVGTIDFHTILI